MLDFVLLIFLIVLLISLFGLLAAFRSRSRGDKQVYYTAENTADNETEGQDS